MPYIASASGTGGLNGLVTVPSGALTNAPTTVASTTIVQLAFAFQSTSSDTTPALMMYLAAGADGMAHVYGLDLSNAATAPAPKQVGSLSLTIPGTGIGTLVCGSGQAQDNLNTPSTTFVVIHIAGSTGCNTTGDVWDLVNYTDSTSTAPVAVNIKTSLAGALMTPFYAASGALSGLAVLDTISGNLNFYPTKAFTNPTVLWTAATGANVMYWSSTAQTFQAFGGTLAYFSATDATAPYLLRVTYDGTKVMRYQGKQLGESTFDDNNLYFNDSVPPLGAGGATRVSIWQEPLTGQGALTQLYSTNTSNPFLIGANDTQVVFSTTAIDTNTGTSTTTISTVPVGMTSANATQLGPTLGGTVNAFMAGPYGTSASALAVFATETDQTISGTGITYSYQTEVLTPGGTVYQALLANSAFASGASGLSGVVFQVQNITDTSSGYGGGTIYSIAPGPSLTKTTMTAADGGAYSVPAGATVYAFPLSRYIGSGGLWNFSATPSKADGLGYDLTKAIVAPVSLPNTQLIFF
jgi:hypothetical protein